MSAAVTASPSTVPSETSLRLQHAFKVALSMVLMYWLALAMNWDMPKYGALAIALISLDTTGASLHKGVMRIVGTTVGLALGMLGLALFAQDVWLELLFQASYLVVVGYCMQTSRYPYAWFVAGFLPSLVWATTYGKVDNAFHYAIFRYLETSAGIIIYTLVSALLWPRRAGDQLGQQGAGFCTGLRELFGIYRRHLEDGATLAAADELRNRLAGTLPKLLATLDAAYADTPSVAAQKRAWEAFRVNARAIGDSLELWRQSLDDCRRLDLDRLLPRVHTALETLDRRLARIDDLWRVRSAGEEVSDTEDGDDSLLESLQLDVGRNVGGDLSHLDRGALLSFVQQLTVLDVASRDLLRTIRVLAGLTPVRAFHAGSLPRDLYRPTRWDPVRLVNGLLPAVSFTVAYFFWIYFDPPTGPSVPNMAAIFGLLVLMSRMNVLVLLPLLLIAIWCLVAPVYFLVMPQLDLGLELLALIFGFTFAVSMFSGRLVALKATTMPMFVMMTGISNQQNYSFMGLVDGALMIMLALVIIAVVQTLLSPIRPEQTLLSSVRRFFRGCARVVGEFALDGPADRAKGRRLRKRHFESMVLPTTMSIQTAQKSLDYRLYPDNTSEKVQRLHDSLQSIAYRLQSLEITHDRITRESTGLPAPLVPLRNQMRETVQRVFERWASLEAGDAIEQQRGSMEHLSHELQQQLDDLETGQDREPISDSDRALTDLYTWLGSLRGLIGAMADTQAVINQINWRQWAIARF
jgi:uncharacterized membrane protein YccC